MIRNSYEISLWGWNSYIFVWKAIKYGDFGATNGGGAAGDSPLKCEAFQNFRQRRKFGSAPCCWAVITKGAVLQDRAAQPYWEHKRNHTLHKLMGAANVTNENTQS